MRTPPVVAAGLVAALGAGVAWAATGDLTRVSLTDGGAQGTQAATRTAVSADGRYVAFLSTQALTTAPTGGVRQLYVRDRVANRTILASSDAAGVAANAAVVDGDSFNPFHAISGDGRFVVFASPATNLVSGDANGKQDVFRKDLTTGEVVIVSRNTAGEQANADVFGDPSISYDGARVAFTTGTATNLFPGDPNGTNDVVVRDIPAGTTTLVSQSSAGVHSNGTTERPSISADGRVVAFEAVLDATNLFPNDANATNDVLVRDLEAGTTVAADVATDGQIPGANKPRISGDGRYVVFDTGNKLDPVADTNAGSDVYRRDLVAGTTLLMSARDGLTTAGAQGGNNPDISADGTRVSFESASTDLTSADANAATTDVYARTGTATVRASSRADGGQGDNASGTASVAGNGGTIAFTYDDVGGKPLITGDTNLVEDVFAKELTATDLTAPVLGVTVPATVAATDTQVTVQGTVGADPSGIGSVTVNGARVALASGAFTTPVTLDAGQATTVTVLATDGSGNTATSTSTVTRRAADTTPKPIVVPPTRARVTRIRAGRQGRIMVVRFCLSANARVRIEVLRLRTTPTRRLVPVIRPVTRTLRAGDRIVRLRLPSATRRAYRVRVTVPSFG